MTEMCISAANHIVNQVNKNNQSGIWNVTLSSKRLQKLLYFSDVLYMTENKGKSMYTDEYHAWPSGPVIPSVYNIFMRYQDGKMYPYNYGIHAPLDSKMKTTLDRVLEATKDLSTDKLIDESHKKYGPWYQVNSKRGESENDVISKDLIYKYYIKCGAPYGASLSPLKKFLAGIDKWIVKKA